MVLRAADAIREIEGVRYIFLRVREPVHAEPE